MYSNRQELASELTAQRIRHCVCEVIADCEDEDRGVRGAGGFRV